MSFEKKPSEKQIEANRLNALKSTGPQTEEGKNRSRLNARRHGLTSMVTLMTDPDREAHNKFMKDYIADLQPEGAREAHLAQSIAYDAWRMNRIRAIEENTFALGMNRRFADIDCGHPEIHSATVQALTFWQDPGKFALLSLYEQRILRGFHKNTALYREIQKERETASAEPQPTVSEPLTMAAGAAASPAAEARPVTTPGPSPERIIESETYNANGFVCANTAAAAAATPYGGSTIEEAALHRPSPLSREALSA